MKERANDGVSRAVTGLAINSESIQEHIHPYLTLEQKEALAQALSRFPTDKEYYLIGKYRDELLQGDCWTKLQLRRFDTGERKGVSGIILSNTCDVSPENKREIPPNIVFAPIMKLSSYTALLEKAGLEGNTIKNKIDTIKAQAVTTIFYLPDAIGGFGEDHIIILDDVHTMPSSAFQSDSTKRKAFTLNTFGFYLFIFKLSVHFCRLRENVERTA